VICLLDMSPRNNTTQYAILGLLAVRPMSGYDLSKSLRESLNHFWAESNGQIYPSLKRLAAEGLIIPVVTHHTGRRTPQKYALAPAGRKKLKEWLGEPPKPQPPRNELLLKLFLGRSAPRGAVERHIASFKRQYEEILSTFMGIAACIRKEQARSPDLKYWMLCLEHGIRLRQAQIDWCSSALRVLATAPQANPGQRSATRG
jgi:PadR family transcriptional regulator, regulatory protein AphA